MRRAWWILTVALACACTDGPTDDTSDTDTGDTGDGCPEGLSAARDPGMFISIYQYNGLNRSPLFEEGTYLDRPSGCISDNGRTVDYLFLLLGDPYGRVAVSDASTGGYAISASDAPDVELEIFGEDGEPRFANDDFVTGTLSINSTGTQFDMDFSGSALTNIGGTSYSMSMTFSLEGR